MGYITKEWMDAHDAVIQNKLLPLSDAAIVKTLSSVPTESTLTYLIGQVSHNFLVGDEVRVADTDGYVYYKLYDINNGSAIWNKLGGGDSILASTIKVTLQSIVNGNVTAGTDLNGVTVSVQNITDNNTSAVTKQWYGNELTFDNLTPTKQYTISVSSVNGYSQPASYTTSALGLGETVSRTFQYEANSYTVSIDSDLDDKTTIANAKVIYNNVQYANGSTLLVPASVTLVAGQNVTATDLSDLDYKVTITISNNTITVLYSLIVDKVDLGLPSGKLWAKGNLIKNGSEYSIGEETDWGTYVSWGNIVGHNEGEGYDFSETNYNSTPGHSVAANIPSNDAAHDIALATLGTPWHLPTKEDFQELYDNTDSEWVADYNNTGVAGRKFMKKSDHSIFVFFPAAGYYDGTSLDYHGTYGVYWSSSFRSATYAYRLFFYSSSVNPQDYYLRLSGLTVRPICILTKNITITLNSTDESSVDNIQVTVTDSEGISHSGTTDSNGVATISNVAVGSCTVKVQGKGVSPKTITVATSITSFTLDCYDQVEISGYMIDQSNADTLAANMIKDVDGNDFDGSRNSNEIDDVIYRIRENSKLYAAATTLSNGKLQIKEVSKTDKTKWTDGTSISGTYDYFMKLPEFWWRCYEKVENSDQWIIEFSMGEQSGWNHWEGDTFLGVYKAYWGTDNLLYSRRGVTPKVSQSWENFTYSARRRGTGYTLITYETHCMLALLGYGWLGTTDDLSVVGYGSSTYPKTTGLCDAKGMTDTQASVDGGATAGQANDGKSINFWGLENIWGDIYEWVDNLKTANSSYLINVLSTSNLSTVNRTVQGPSSNGCIAKTMMGTNGDMIPKSYVSDSNYTKGFSAAGYVRSSSGYVANRSYYGSYAHGGLAFLNVSRSVSDSSSYIGSRLQYKGNFEEINLT